MEKVISVFTMLFAFVTLSLAQYQGPGKVMEQYTVKEIKSNASKLDRTDAIVKIQGFIVKQIDNDTYEFKDSTGTIHIDLDKKKVPGQPFDETTEIIIIGEVDYDLLEPVEIEVDEVIFVNKQSDER